jgi:hypothetical protein
LSAEQKAALILKLVRELPDAVDRLKQNPHNRSRPPSSAPPWAGDSGENPEAERGEFSRAEPAPFAPPVLDGAATESTHPQGERKEHPQEKRKAGRQQGAAGPSRSVGLPVTGEQCHYPTQGEGWGEVFDAKGFVARAGV